MRLTQDTMDRLREDMEAEVDRQIKEYPIKLKIDGKEVDLDDIQIDGGEIEINIRTPFCFPGSGQFAGLKTIYCDDHCGAEPLGCPTCEKRMK